MKNSTRLPNARNEGLIVRELDDETLVYDTDRDEAHCLNRAAALVWQLCDGKTTSTQAARQLRTTLRVDVDSDFVWLAVGQLQKFRLVEPATKFPSVSRRDLVFRYGPAIVSLPVIMSITAPTPAQSASCVCPSCCTGFHCNGSSCVPN